MKRDVTVEVPGVVSGQARQRLLESVHHCKLRQDKMVVNGEFDWRRASWKRLFQSSVRLASKFCWMVKSPPSPMAPTSLLRALPRRSTNVASPASCASVLGVN